METSMQGEVEQTAPTRIADRVRKRLNDAMLRIAREAHPASTPEELKHMVERWRLVAQGMGVAATVVDMAIAATATGVGINTLAGIKRFSPIHLEATPALAEYFAEESSPAAQRRRNAFKQIAVGLPLFGAAAGVAAFRPGKVGLSLAAEAVGFAGEKVTRIVRRIVQGTPNSTDRTVYYGVGKP